MENEELYWAARGAGPGKSQMENISVSMSELINVGFPAIVTRFYLQTKPLPRHVRSSAYIFPKTLFRTSLNWINSIAEAYDQDTEIVCVGRFIPEYDESVIIVGLTSFKDSDDDAILALGAAERSVPSGYLQKHFAQATSLQEQYIDQGSANPEGHRYCSDNAYIHNDADVAAVLEETFTTLPTRKSFALWYAMAPTSRRTLPDMALSMQSDHYLAIYSIWETNEGDDKCQSWVSNVMNRVAPHSVGQYLGDSDFQVRNTKYWSEEHGKKLMKIREKWNPDGRICGYLDKGDHSGATGLINKL
jgi:predicted kinase